MKIDFTNCQTEPLKMYGGANGSKICVKHNGEDYMLKFPPKDNVNYSDINDRACGTRVPQRGDIMLGASLVD